MRKPKIEVAGWELSFDENEPGEITIAIIGNHARINVSVLVNRVTISELEKAIECVKEADKKMDTLRFV